MQHLHKQRLTNGGSGVILNTEKGAVGKTVSPLLDYEVTAGLEARRLLLFIDLNEQATKIYDHKAKLKNFGCTHNAAPLS